MLRTVLLVIVSFVSGAAAATFSTSPVAAQDRKTVTRDLVKLDLAEWCPGKELLISQLTNSVGGTGRHSHPAHSYTYVIEGAQMQLPDGGTPITARAGEVYHEAPGAISATRTLEPSKVLVVRVAEKGKPVTVPAP